MAIIKCGDWSCSREATQLARPTYRKGEPDAGDLRCNVHVGAIKRSMATAYGTQYSIWPLGDWPSITALAAKQAEEDEARKRRNVELRRQEVELRRQEARADAVARTVKDWEDYDSEPTYRVGVSAEWDAQRGVPALGIFIGDDKPNQQVRAVSVSRYDDLPSPLLISLSSMRSMTPAEARALAKALIIIAGNVEAANLDRPTLPKE